MKKLTIVILTLFLAYLSYAEIISRVMVYNGTGNGLDQCNGIVQDKFGKVYATGVSWGGSTTKEDYATVKFSEDGDFIWAVRFDGAGHNLDYASAIGIDNEENIYVTGWSRQGSSLTSEDYCTIKYNSNGQMQWVKFYDGYGSLDCEYYDHAVDIFVDDLSNVYVTGYSINGSNNEDFATVKYNKSGVQLWAKRYNGPNNLNDRAYDIFVDESGNVYVTGGSQATNKGYDYVTIKYNSSGVQQWAVRYDADSKDDISRSLVADRFGNVYVTGSSNGGTNKLDYVTIKYNTTGAQQWLARYNGTANDTDVATSIDLDVYGIPYITGYSKNAGTGYDYCTIKYKTDNGGAIWMRLEAGGGTVINASDFAYKIKVVNKVCVASRSNELFIPCWVIDVYVTGSSKNNITGEDYMTAHYSENGNYLWANLFNGAGASYDAAFDINVRDGYPIVYCGGLLNNNYGIIGITESRMNKTGFDKGLSNNYPNPFNPETEITFNLKGKSFVKLMIYDALGREVIQLAGKEFEEGTHSLKWNATGSTSGIYFYRIETAFGNETKKIVLIK